MARMTLVAPPLGGLRTSRCAVALLLLAVVMACGSDTSGDGEEGSSFEPLTSGMAVLASATFVSTMVEGHDLVPDSSVEVSFDEETMSVSGGCNTLFGPFVIAEGILKWTADPAASMMACPDDLSEQDQWLTDLLTAGVTATTDGHELHLTSGTVTLQLERKPAVALGTLLGRTWSVVGTLSDGTTSRLPSRVRTPRLVVGHDGLSRLDTGCNTGRTRVQVDRVSVTFAPPTVTRIRCPEPERFIERLVLSVVDGRSDYLTFNGWLLFVIKDGTGLLFHVG